MDVEDYTHRQLVNEIANRAFLTADTNQEISSAPPEEYLPRVEERFPGALARQFVPMDPQLWKVDRFRDFLAARREAISRKMNEYNRSLIAEHEAPLHRPIADLVRLGESYSLEFKSTLQWDVVAGQENKGLRQQVLKTVAAFLNSAGGTLAPPSRRPRTWRIHRSPPPPQPH